VPPGGDLAAKDFLVTYFDPTLTSEVDSATSEIDRKSYVRIDSLQRFDFRGTESESRSVLRSPSVPPVTKKRKSKHL